MNFNILGLNLKKNTDNNQKHQCQQGKETGQNEKPGVRKHPPQI